LPIGAFLRRRFDAIFERHNFRNQLGNIRALGVFGSHDQLTLRTKRRHLPGRRDFPVRDASWGDLMIDYLIVLRETLVDKSEFVVFDDFSIAISHCGMNLGG
jgi:hypothetical protein